MSVDYRSTVFLPKTDFPMRGGLAQREPETLAAAAAELGPEAVSVQGDVADLADLDRFYSEIDASFGSFEDFKAAFNNIHVAVGDRVKRTGVYGNLLFHVILSSGRSLS